MAMGGSEMDDESVNDFDVTWSWQYNRSWADELDLAVRQVVSRAAMGIAQFIRERNYWVIACGEAIGL